jgi:hypothetical protein
VVEDNLIFFSKFDKFFTKIYMAEEYSLLFYFSHFDKKFHQKKYMKPSKDCMFVSFILNLFFLQAQNVHNSMPSL